MLDAEEIGSENWSPPLEEDFWDAGKEQALLEDSTISIGFFDSSLWGDLIVAYALVKDAEGNIVSLLGVDVSGEVFYTHLNKVLFILLIVYIIVMIFTAIISHRYSGGLIDRLFKDKLTGAYTKRHAETFIQKAIKESLKLNKSLIFLFWIWTNLKILTTRTGIRSGTWF